MLQKYFNTENSIFPTSPVSRGQHYLEVVAIPTPNHGTLGPNFIQLRDS